MASYCPDAWLINCWCWPLPSRLTIATIQNPCQDLVALLPGLSWGRSGVWLKKLDPHSGGLCSEGWCRAPMRVGLGRLKPFLPPSLLAASGIAGSGRYFPAHLQGEGAGGEEAAAGSRQELRLGVGRGLLCWELSSGSHQWGGKEGAAFLGPHTPTGPAGTQPAGLQPALPVRGSVLCPAFPSTPPAQACHQRWCWAALVRAQQRHGAAAGLPFGRCIPQSFGYEAGETHPAAFVLSSTAAIIRSVFPIPLVARHHRCKARGDPVEASWRQGCNPLLPNPVPLSQLG